MRKSSPKSQVGISCLILSQNFKKVNKAHLVSVLFHIYFTRSLLFPYMQLTAAQGKNLKRRRLLKSGRVLRAGCSRADATLPPLPQASFHLMGKKLSASVAK